MSRILSTAKLVLFAAIFGAMIFVGCNNISSDDEPLGTGGGTEGSGSGTTGGNEEGGDGSSGGTEEDGNGDVMPATITIGEYTAKVDASEGVTYSDGKFILLKASDDENKATLSLVFDESIDVSKYAGFYFSYIQSVGHKYSGSLQFFDSDEDEDENRTFAKWGIGSWSESGGANGSVTTASSDTYGENDTDEQKATKDAAYVDALKNLKMIKFAASTDFDWTVYGFKFTGSGNTGETDTPGEDDDGNAIELPGIDFSDSSAESMVTGSYNNNAFTVENGYLKITMSENAWETFLITYPTEQDLTNKNNIKITGYLGDDWKYAVNDDGTEKSVNFQVEDIDGNEGAYGGDAFELTSSESTITSGFVYKVWNSENEPDYTKIVAVKIYPQDSTGTLYIKSIEFVD